MKKLEKQVKSKAGGEKKRNDKENKRNQQRIEKQQGNNKSKSDFLRKNVNKINKPPARLI